ncbi:MAG: sigma 54-interacting transcriptional regulator [Bacillota bacterium]|nr:sigma 54-interacting transcriptional regulator [Bacillota bacterium]
MANESKTANHQKVSQLNLNSDMTVSEVYHKFTSEDVRGAELTDANGRSMGFVITPQLLQDIVNHVYPGQKADKIFLLDSNDSLLFTTENDNQNTKKPDAALMQTIYSAVRIQKKTFDYSLELSRQIDAIFDSSFDGLYMTDGEGNTLRLNKGFERITGLSAEECVGRNMADLVKEGIYSRSGTLIALEQRQRITTTLETKTGKTVLATSNPIFDDDDNIILVVTDVCDITALIDLQRKTCEEEELTDSAKHILPIIELPDSKHYLVRSSEMRSLIDMTIRVATSDSTVLIQGESGVGKEMITDLIHANSARKNAPLIKVNCAAIPENLLESELFGYEPSAFSGASKNGKPGYFELANNGILFFDEIGEMPMNLQVKLLRVLQAREVTRIGGVKPQKIDVRILTATNRDLFKMVENNEFRQDLFYRLSVVPIYVPSLRERSADIPALSEFFVDSFNEKYDTMKRLTPEVIQCFMDYHWPGNIRELENLIERLIVTVAYDTITTKDLPGYLMRDRLKMDRELVPLRLAVENTEIEMLKMAFSKYKSTYDVAQALEINQSTVVRKAARYGITKNRSIE